MRYRLAVLTHGRSEPLEQTLRSFFENVTPLPSSVRVYADGAGGPAVVLDAFAKTVSDSDLVHLESSGRTMMPVYPFPLSVQHPSEQVGFCRATAALWQETTDGDDDFVFWLEHDFFFLRPVDLREPAAVLKSRPDLAQVALVRGPANPVEIRAGGLVESRPGEFALVAETPPFLLHRSYFTTNPSLMRRKFMAENPWPVYPSECEGRFGIDLLSRGFSFAAWGTGEAWIRHVGVRDRHGRGY